MVAMQTELLDSDGNPWGAVVAATVQGGQIGTPQLVCISFQPLPGGGGGIFSGNAFATPPVTDGVRVAFSAQYEQGDRTDLVGLFVWNSSTGNITRAMDATSVVDGQSVTGIDITSSSFVDGKLAVMLQLGDQNAQGIYVVDLSGY
jgi:hypothetical protein